MRNRLIPPLFLLGAATFVVACTERFEDRCRREAKEYTEKQCPRLIDKDACIIMDSMTFATEPIGFTYHYHVQGQLDNPELLTPETMENFRENLLNNVRKDISLKTYKEKGFTFTYRYLSASTGDVFTESVITPEDYK